MRGLNFVIVVLLISIVLSGCVNSNSKSSSTSSSNLINGTTINSADTSSTNNSSDQTSSSVVATSTSKTAVKSQSDVDKEVSLIMKGTILKTDKYLIETYTSPYWEGNIVYNESVYPMNNADSSISPMPLLYHADKIICVRNAALNTVYVMGKDYDLKNGKLIILPNSQIRINEYSRYYLDAPIQNKSFERVGGGYISFSEGSTFHSRQIAVTYVHTDKWAGPISAKKGSKLPNLMKKLANKSNINIVYYGDSISTGANSSSTIMALPNADSFPVMLTKTLEEKYGVKITHTNTSMGGQISSWGYQNVQSKVVAYNPDLVVIGWGMNDGTVLNNVSTSVFEANIKGIILSVRAKNPNAEFIVIGTFLPNKEVVGFFGLQSEYNINLQNIEKSFTGVAFANVTEMHEYLLTKKRYYDMTGNNVNHPNDFIARLYSQILIRTLEK